MQKSKLEFDVFFYSSSLVLKYTCEDKGEGGEKYVYQHLPSGDSSSQRYCLNITVVSGVCVRVCVCVCVCMYMYTYIHVCMYVDCPHVHILHVHVCFIHNKIIM